MCVSLYALDAKREGASIDGGNPLLERAFVAGNCKAGANPMAEFTDTSPMKSSVHVFKPMFHV